MFKNWVKLRYHTSGINSVFNRVLQESRLDDLECAKQTSSPRLNGHIIGIKEHIEYLSN